MVDNFMVYKVISTESFSRSLRRYLLYWDVQGLTSSQISNRIRLIQTGISSLTYCPQRYERITKVYGFLKETRRILIRNTHAIFYRINTEEAIVIVGGYI